MFDPTGAVRMVPSDQADAATQAGGQPAVKMFDPDGNPKWVPQAQQAAALKAGGSMTPPAPKPLLQQAVEGIENLPGMQMASGFMKGAEKTGAGALEAVAKNLQTPVAPRGGIGVPEGYARPTAVAGPVPGAMQKTAGWLRQNTDTQGWEKVGDVGENIAELLAAPELAPEASGAEGAKALSYADQLLQQARQAKILESNTGIQRLVRIGINAIRGGAEMGGQTYLKSGGDVQQTEEQALGGLVGGGGAGVATEGLGAVRAALARQAAELAPTTEEAAGTTYPLLRSEAVGPQGQSIATPLQKEAAQIANRPDIRAARQIALQQAPRNLAKTGLENALNDRVSTAPGPFGAEPTITPGQSQTWRYISPDGTSLSPAEAKDALTNLRERWLSEDWGPQQDAQFSKVHDDLKNQLDRHEAFMENQSHFANPDVSNLVDNTNSLSDAAGHLDLLARQRLQYLDPETQSAYRDLAAQRSQLQDEFDRAKDVPLDRQRAAESLNDVNGQIEDIFKQPDVAANLSQPEADQALKDQRLSNAFTTLENVMQKHLNITPEAAAATGQPSVGQGMGSLAKDIENVRAKYGDVLDPVLGPNGLNHIIKLSQQMKTPAGADAVTGLVGNIASMYKRHYINIAGLAGALGSGTMYHLFGHVAGLAALPASLAEASISGSRKYLIQRMATDPAFNNTIRYAAQRGIPPRIAGAIIAAKLGVSRIAGPLIHPAPPAGATNATGQ
jgi:hypothetical protein